MGVFMKNYCNMEYFASNYYKSLEIPKELEQLFLFTLYSSIMRNSDEILSKFKNITINYDGSYDYYFRYGPSKYPFSVFSDYSLQEFDRKLLESDERQSVALFRTLKLACSMDLLCPRVAIGNSLLGIFAPLILFKKNGTDKVIDYARGLVMNKKDYYDIFRYNEINVVDKMDLYCIYSIMTVFDTYAYLFEYLIFTKEIFSELAQQKIFNFLFSKYDKRGINRCNSLLFGNLCDHLFFQEEDCYKRKYDAFIREVDKFTFNSSVFSEHISYCEEKKQYLFEDDEFGYFTFGLLSDMIDATSSLKKKLLSDLRYHGCHSNVHVVAEMLPEADRSTSFIVGGRFKENESDYFLHSWLEIEGKNVVIDFNHNIIMNRDKYYKLFDVEVMSKTSVVEMDDIIQTVCVDAQLDVSTVIINYFGKEIMRDLKKNEKIFQKDSKRRF